MLDIGQIVYTVCAKQVGSYKKPEYIAKYGREYPVTHYNYKLYISSQKIIKFLGDESGITYITENYLSFQEISGGNYVTVSTPTIIPNSSEEEQIAFKSKPVFLTSEEAKKHLQSHKEYVESTYSHAKVVGIIGGLSN